MSKEVLSVKNLNMHYETLSGDVHAVKDVSFSVKEGESFGLVGESGLSLIHISEPTRPY